MHGTKFYFLVLVFLLCSSVWAQWDFAQADSLVYSEPFDGKGLSADLAGNAYTIGGTDHLILSIRSVDTGEWSAPISIVDSAASLQISDAAVYWNQATEQPIVAYESFGRIWFATRDDQGVWQHTVLNAAGEEGSSPDIAANAGGQIYVVWIDNDEGEYQLNYSYFDGSTWEANDIQAELGDFGNGAEPRVAVEPSGAGDVLFRGIENGNYRAKVAANESGGDDNWILTTMNVAHPESYPGDIVCGVDGTIYCVTSGSEGFGIPGPSYYHRRFGGQWNFGTSISGGISATSPVIAIAETFTPHTLWLEISGNILTGNLGYSDGAHSWNSSMIFDRASGRPAFAIDGNNYGHLLMRSDGIGMIYLRSSEPLEFVAGTPAVTLTPETMQFDSTEVNSLRSQGLTILNSGDGPLIVTQLTSDNEVFVAPEIFTINLAPGATLTADVGFRPSEPGDEIGFIQVWSSASTSPDTCVAMGRGYVIADAEETLLPKEFALRPLYPNPFNSSVNVEFDLAAQTLVTLDVYDLLGRKVETLLSGTMGAGSHSVQWDAGERAAGVYLFKLDAGGVSVVRKAAFLK